MPWRPLASCSSSALGRDADAFVIDIGLPDADGRDLCQALRAQGVQAPMLFLTARDALTDRLSGFSAGGDDYVTKPFDIEEVVVRLRRAAAPLGSRTPAPTTRPGCASTRPSTRSSLDGATGDS